MFSLFFFSSRRRHTRCLSDWSSDVCSSDLGVMHVEELLLSRRAMRRAGVEHVRPLFQFARAEQTTTALRVGAFERGVNRSEERRVGKECRYRLSEYE